jgi:UTP-glucose-1-phosphate uridylyltransferase
VIAAAGLGARLPPMGKELSKETLPIFVKSVDGFALKPPLQVLLEQPHLPLTLLILRLFFAQGVCF